ncbi:flavodoxin FldB [Microbulbifer sp. HZ11]|uniref:flavodoxin FldB n=1 Tax=Microbulbifer sp. HZ11 TaxID=1453501 RepID=UPI0005BDED75|nr:flavodoxin FldB [Microbulbifer sp. HZ11]
MKIGIYFDSTSGNTEVAAKQIHDFFGDDLAELNTISDAGFPDLEIYDLVIFGIPTWDYGHLQSDWEELWPELEETDLSNATIALFGLGDQYGYPEWYLDAMGILHDLCVGKGAEIIGHWPNQGYEFESSKALTDDGKHFVGLALDEDCQPEKTEQRITDWCTSLLQQMSSKCDAAAEVSAV